MWKEETEEVGYALLLLHLYPYLHHSSDTSPHTMTAAAAPESQLQPVAQPRHQQAYEFPHHRLARTLKDPSKTPLVLVACGSFSPITHMHHRMFEMAVDHVRQNMSDEYEVVGGYMSPVSDRYNKAGLASASHRYLPPPPRRLRAHANCFARERLRMCELACEETSEWIMVDQWEAIQPEYQPTALVLDHVAYEVNAVLGGVSPYEGAPKSEFRKAQVSLLSGSDLLQTMSASYPEALLSTTAPPPTLLRPVLLHRILTVPPSNPASGVSPILITS